MGVGPLFTYFWGLKPETLNLNRQEKELQREASSDSTVRRPTRGLGCRDFPLKDSGFRVLGAPVKNLLIKVP